jgi:hypothetical protein
VTPTTLHRCERTHTQYTGWNITCSAVDTRNTGVCGVGWRLRFVNGSSARSVILRVGRAGGGKSWVGVWVAKRGATTHVTVPDHVVKRVVSTLWKRRGSRYLL